MIERWPQARIPHCRAACAPRPHPDNGFYVTRHCISHSGRLGVRRAGAVSYTHLDAGANLFDVSQIGAGQAYRGFDRFEKTGASTWILSGTGTQDWLVKQGSLAGNTQSIGGNVNFANASNATLFLDQGTRGTYAGTISGEGALAKTCLLYTSRCV